MTLIPVLILAAGLNGAVSSPMPASHAQQAQARVNRMVTASAPVLHQRAVSRAIAAGAQRLGTDIERELSLTRVKPAQASSPRARLGSIQPAAAIEPGLTVGQASLFPLLAAPTEEAEAAVTGSSGRTAPVAPRPKLSTLLFGGVLIGFLALAGLTATAFTRLTS